MEFHQLPVKKMLMIFASFLLAVVITGIFMKYFVASESARQFCLLWFWLGGAMAPTKPNTPEWEFWIWSPMLGLARFICGIFARLFVK